MTIKDYINLPSETINSMTKEELLKLTRQFALPTTAKQRRLFNSDEFKDLPVVSSVLDYQNTSFFVNKNMSLNELRHIARLQKNFLQLKTSSLSGIKDVLDDFYDRIIKTGIEKGVVIERVKLNKEQYKKLWEVYNRIESEYQSVGYDSNQIQTEIYKVISSERAYMSVDDIIESLPNSSRIYEEYKTGDIDDDDIFSFGKHSI